MHSLRATVTSHGEEEAVSISKTYIMCQCLGGFLVEAFAPCGAALEHIVSRKAQNHPVGVMVPFQRNAVVFLGWKLLPTSLWSSQGSAAPPLNLS